MTEDNSFGRISTSDYRFIMGSLHHSGTRRKIYSKSFHIQEPTHSEAGTVLQGCSWHHVTKSDYFPGGSVIQAPEGSEYSWLHNPVHRISFYLLVHSNIPMNNRNGIRYSFTIQLPSIRIISKKGLQLRRWYAMVTCEMSPRGLTEKLEHFPRGCHILVSEAVPFSA